MSSIQNRTWRGLKRGRVRTRRTTGRRSAGLSSDAFAACAHASWRHVHVVAQHGGAYTASRIGLNEPAALSACTEAETTLLARATQQTRTRRPQASDVLAPSPWVNSSATTVPAPYSRLCRSTHVRRSHGVGYLTSTSMRTLAARNPVLATRDASAERWARARTQSRRRVPGGQSSGSKSADRAEEERGEAADETHTCCVQSQRRAPRPGEPRVRTVRRARVVAAEPSVVRAVQLDVGVVADRVVAVRAPWAPCLSEMRRRERARASRSARPGSGRPRGHRRRDFVSAGRARGRNRTEERRGGRGERVGTCGGREDVGPAERLWSKENSGAYTTSTACGARRSEKGLRARRMFRGPSSPPHATGRVT
jgi:hypothetical protein